MAQKVAFFLPVGVMAFQNRKITRLDRADVEVVLLHRVGIVDVEFGGQLLRRTGVAAAARPGVEERPACGNGKRPTLRVELSVWRVPSVAW